MNITDESSYSIRDAIIQVILKWKLLLLLALIGTLGALVRHKYFPVYPGEGKILIKDQAGSSLETVLSQFSNSGPVSSTTTLQSRLDRSLSYLETTEFNRALASKIWSQMLDDAQPMEMREEIKLYLKSLNINTEIESNVEKEAEISRLGNFLRRTLQWNKTQSGLLVVRIKTDRKSWTIHLINEALFVARSFLTSKELKDIDEATRFFTMEIYEVETRLRELELSTMQALKKSDILNIEAERGEASQYITNLRKNISDTEIKIREGRTLLAGLRKRVDVSAGGNEEAALSKFALSGQIRHLEDEIKTLELRKDTLAAYLKSYGSTTKSILPIQNEMERIKANYDFEFKVYENLRRGMAKLGLERTFIENQIEILEGESALKVFSRPGLLVLLLVAVTISQILGLGIIALNALFTKSKEL